MREALQPKLTTDGIALDNLSVDIRQQVIKNTTVVKRTLSNVDGSFSFHLSLLSAKFVPKCEVKSNKETSIDTLRPIMVRLARICLFDGKKFIGNSHVIAATPEKKKAMRQSSIVVAGNDGEPNYAVPVDQIWTFDSKGNNDMIVRCKIPPNLLDRRGFESQNQNNIFMYIELNVSFDFNDEDRKRFQDYNQRTRSSQVDEVCCCWGFYPLPFDRTITGNTKQATNLDTIKGRGKELRIPLTIGRLKVPDNLKSTKANGKK